MMNNARHSRFDPDYEDEEISNADMQAETKPRRSRFEDDDEPIFRVNKRRQTSLFNKESGDAFGEPDEEEYEEERRKAPFIVRLFAWVTVLVLICAGGYYAGNYVIDYVQGKSENRVADSGTATDISLEDKKEAGKSVGVAEDVSVKKYKLYIPDGKDFAVRPVEIAGGRIEQDMQHIMGMYFDSLREKGIISSDVRFTNIFKSGDLLYINAGSDFEKMVQSLDENRATQVITGMLSTLWNNFSVRKAKFYINSEESQVREPVDLSAQWGL